MSIFSDFQESIEASDSLLSMYAELRLKRGLGARGRLDAQNEDLLWLPRSAVVAAISALDSYVHAVLYDRIPGILNSGNIPQPLGDAMARLTPIKDSNSFSSALRIVIAGNFTTHLSNEFKDKTLSFLSYQAPDKIIAGYALIGVNNVFEQVAKTWQGPNSSTSDLKRILANYVKRRNQIAHEGDRDQQGNARPMQPDYARNCKAFIENLVVRLEKIA